MVLRGHWAHRRTDHLIKHLFNERRTNASMCQIITNAREGNLFRTYILHVHKICRFLIAQARQHLGVVFAGENRADDPQTSRAGDVGDDVVELEIHLCQRLLHMLDM